MDVITVTARFLKALVRPFQPLFLQVETIIMEPHVGFRRLTFLETLELHRIVSTLKALDATNDTEYEALVRRYNAIIERARLPHFEMAVLPEEV